MMLRADRRNFVASVELASAAPALNWSYARLPLRLAAWSLAALLAASLGWTAETRGSTAAAAKTPGIFSPDHRSAEAAHESRELQPFAAGRWVFTGYGSAAVGKTSHQVYAGHLGLGYYLIDDVALNVEAIGYFVDHSRSSGAGGIDLLARWHYLSRDPWSLYVEGGGGFIYSDNTLREPGTHFNFTVQGGAGTTYQFVNGHAAMLGIRWFHISNARIRGKERNVGFDSPMFYVGLMTLF